MGEDFFNRLDKYMEFKCLNDNKVTVQTGIPVGSLGKQRKGARGLSASSIAKILCMYEDLNADWLITGRGAMLNTSSEELDSNAENKDGLLIDALLKLARAQENLIDAHNERDYYKNLLEEHGISANYNAKKAESA